MHRLTNFLLLSICGSSAGILATLVSFPLDLIRSRQMVSSVQQWPYSGPFRRMEYRSIAAAVSTIYKNRGLAGFYHGLGVSLLGVIPLEAGRFGVFFTLLETLKEMRNGRPASASERLLCGYAAGTAAIFVSYPFDCVRRRMQVEAISAESTRTMSRTPKLRKNNSGSARPKQGQRGGSGPSAVARLEPLPSRSAAGIAVSIFSEHPRQFFRGLYLTKLINPIRTAITFTVYTHLVDFLEGSTGYEIDE